MEHRILALDDEPDMLRLLERIIREKTPYKIETSGNPLELPQILERERFDLIITDLKMPGMDGLDILKLVRQKDLDTEVIIITAFGSLETAALALSRGVFDYITKPFRKEQIIMSVDRALRCQVIKRESRATGRLFDMIPYAKAEEAFRREYIKRLLARSGDDVVLVADRTGLPLDQIEMILRDNS